MIRLLFQFWWVGQTERVTWVTWYSCTRDVSTTRTFSQQEGSQQAVREFIPYNFWATYIFLLLEFSSLRILQGTSLSFWGNFVTRDCALITIWQAALLSLLPGSQSLLGFKKRLCIYLWFEIGNKLSQKAVAIWPVTGQAKLPASPIFFLIILTNRRIPARPNYHTSI